MVTERPAKRQRPSRALTDLVAMSAAEADALLVRLAGQPRYDVLAVRRVANRIRRQFVGRLR